MLFHFIFWKNQFKTTLYSNTLLYSLSFISTTMIYDVVVDVGMVCLPSRQLTIEKKRFLKYLKFSLQAAAGQVLDRGILYDVIQPSLQRFYHQTIMDISFCLAR